jgi:5-methyltetrahydrofolate--homocysteine methyltransferase
VIDLGVMTPVDKIIETAKSENVSIIGLSGLITPSLDEMVHVAKEMKRTGINIPLLIGGATTSQKHTAIKIAPAYDHPVVHVLDASRSVTVVSNLLNSEKRSDFVKKILDDYNNLRKMHLDKYSERKLLSIDEARKNRFQIAWENVDIVPPNFKGLKILHNYSLEKIRQRIDWTPFFWAWELKGKFPKILKNPKYGNEAKNLYNDAQKLLDKIIAEKSLLAEAAICIYPANSISYDDIEVYTDEHRNTPLQIIHTIRQQMVKSNEKNNLALADFIAPKESGIQDYIGGFALTTGLGIDELLSEYEKSHDDYFKIMIKALADRLAEAFSELLHGLIRKKYWGYAAEENLTNDDLIQEKYQGIRPAPGYPACPDHTEKQILFDLLEVDKHLSIKLTENFAMMPAASVAGYYFSLPKSQYFGVGKIGKDQVQDYARRKGMTIQKIEKWLSPVLGYNI